MSTAANGASLPPLPQPGAGPREVRAALHPALRAEFEQSYRSALARAAESLDLTPVHETVEQWRMRAWITRDPLEHRRAVRRAVHLLTGVEPPEDEPVAVTEARL